MTNCIFCKIVKGEAPSYTIWENDTHMAFLSIYPNTEGFSVVIPKEHQPSYIFDVSDDTREALLDAAKEAALVLERAFDDVGRCGLIFEGFGVDHLHAKVVPLHGTKMGEWQQVASKTDLHFDTYEGYISSNNYYGVEEDSLQSTHKKINGNSLRQ